MPVKILTSEAVIAIDPQHNLHRLFWWLWGNPKMVETGLGPEGVYLQHAESGIKCNLTGTYHGWDKRGAFVHTLAHIYDWSNGIGKEIHYKTWGEKYGRRCLVNEVAKERWYPRSVKMLIVNDNGDMTAWMEASLSNDLNDQGKALRGQLQKYVVDPALDAAVKLAWKAVSSAVTVV